MPQGSMPIRQSCGADAFPDLPSCASVLKVCVLCVYYVRMCILERRRAAARWQGVKGVCLATLTLCVMEDKSRVTWIMAS